MAIFYFEKLCLAANLFKDLIKAQKTEGEQP